MLFWLSLLQAARFFRFRGSAVRDSRPSPPFMARPSYPRHAIRKGEARQGRVWQIGDYHTRLIGAVLHDADGVHVNHQGAGGDAVAITIIGHALDHGVQSRAAFRA